MTIESTNDKLTDKPAITYSECVRSTYSYDEYKGHDNEAIISLNNELDNCRAELLRIEKEIETIQNNCAHEYMFVCRGMYKDSYTCKKCGHYTEH